MKRKFIPGDGVRVNYGRTLERSSERWGPYDVGDVGVVFDVTYLTNYWRVHVKFFRGTEDIFQPTMLSHVDLT